jgi:hypothetical protein
MDNNAVPYLVYDDHGRRLTLYASICSLLRLLNQLSRSRASQSDGDNRDRTQLHIVTEMAPAPGHKGYPFNGNCAVDNNGYLSPAFDPSGQSQKHITLVPRSWNSHLLPKFTHQQRGHVSVPGYVEH